MSPLGLGFLVVASVGWGLNFPIMKHLLTEWPPLSSRGLCGMVGAAALALIAVARRQQLSVPRPMWLRLFLVSALAIGGWTAFMGLALLWLSASEAAVLGIIDPGMGRIPGVARSRRTAVAATRDLAVGRARRYRRADRRQRPRGRR
jgi:probable blue pigment (indigoidine) exporter